MEITNACFDPANQMVCSFSLIKKLDSFVRTNYQKSNAANTYHAFYIRLSDAYVCKPLCLITGLNKAQ